MDEKNKLKKLLTESYEYIRCEIEGNRLENVISLMDSLSASFKLPRTEYDRSGCTPYNKEVSDTYNLDEYVNASFVPTAGTLYIAAQNPLDNKKDVFIYLLIKSNTRLVVSLINDTKYFDEECLHERKIVEFEGREIFVDEVYAIKDKLIRRLRYINWVDFSVLPPDEMDFFHRYFDAIRTETVLVHCIAGVGRTGTFIMYDILKKAEALTLDMFINTFICLRSLRAHLVTNKVQLEFLKNTFLANNHNHDMKINTEPQQTSFNSSP
ncbi:protein tyrosine phosphatase [Ordospora colligata]|uniref:Protein tyrosine phosphatase n=1 Tax=Ordospora colligata OC4 TaxID=1354746 RepID=A0A0B2UKV9_9MICR|nr:protein tyrosine phosphatase [Ordospora colligata OC4]KHN69879.1 protein tyrosine phosphatase [Ordospora colligata OC4]TBU16049.1 protein tyrosine phosphatase [Ordospora colligata]TBU16262.1 protein tyrosine phosphatase [Ordospora colligata]TBU18966.1 protein tyrosine phosphatase [Ordospora colligata]